MIKLFKLASEINIGKDAIVEFLQGKGFDIHNKPTTNLTDDMVNLVFEKFKREKKAADIQREKIQKHKDVKEVKKQDPPKHTEEKPVEHSHKLDFSVFEEVEKPEPPKEKPVVSTKFESDFEKDQIISLAAAKKAAAKKQDDISVQVIDTTKVEKPAESIIESEKIIAPKPKAIEEKPKETAIENLAPAPVAPVAPATSASKKLGPMHYEVPRFEAPKPVKPIIAPSDIDDVHSDEDSQTKFFPPGSQKFNEPQVGSVINLNPYKSDDKRGNNKNDYQNKGKARTDDRNKGRKEYPKDKPSDTSSPRTEPKRTGDFRNSDNRSQDNRPDTRRAPQENRPDARRTPQENRPDARRTPQENRPDARRTPQENRPDARRTPQDNRPDARRTPQDNRPDARRTPQDNRPDARRAPQDNRPDARRPDNRGQDNRGQDNRGQDNRRPDNRGQDNRRPDNRGQDNRGQEFRQDRRQGQDGGQQQFNDSNKFETPLLNRGQDNQFDSRNSDDGRFDPKRKKKRKSIIDVSPGDPIQLKGLTVLGRIDVSPEERARTGKFDSLDDFKSRFDKKKKRIGDDKAAPKVDDAKKGTALKPKLHEQDDKKKKKRKKSIRESISQEDVTRAIRETLAGMDVASSGSLRAKYKMKKKVEREEKEQKLQEEKDRDSKILKLAEFVTTADLANLMGISPSEIILKCMGLGLMVTINQRLDKDTITVIADDYGFTIEFMDDKQVQFEEIDEDDVDSLKPRAPIVTIMGHVDHGKTSLLDFIRSANVVAGEAGGITQHIGAYSVELPDGRSITFLDTPGHEAFTAMRARGAQITDIVVLVVAADDSVMPQTIEAISHAKAANVPIVVAINKIDKPDANPDRIKQQLADQGILVEDWGGKFQSVHISAKKGINIDTLLEKILLEAEILELKANPDRNARGLVIESRMNKGYGSTATIIVQKGLLEIGDPFVAGTQAGRVRALLNERGQKVEFAGPADPVMVIGFDGLPEAGDSFIVTNTDAESRRIANERSQMKREQELRQIRHITLDEISAQIQMGGVKDLFLVIKGDVAGSVEALSDSLYKLSRDEVRVQILHKGVGTITENDVMLAAASNAVVIGFNVTPSNAAKKVAEQERVDIRMYNIIYDCINEIQLALEGLLTPEYKEEITSTVEIRKVFRISKAGNIAGCYVLSGKITRNDKIRIMRNGFKVFEGELSTLKRNKDDVREVEQGYECGIAINNFNDIEEGDIIEGFKINEIRRKFK